MNKNTFLKHLVNYQIICILLPMSRASNFDLVSQFQIFKYHLYQCLKINYFSRQGPRYTYWCNVFQPQVNVQSLQALTNNMGCLIYMKKKTLSIHPHEMKISIYFNSKMETFSLWKSLIRIVKGPFHFILKLIISISKFCQLPLVKP